MSKNITLEHKRRLRSTEIIQKGDVYKHKSGELGHVKYSIGDPVSYCERSGYQFYRRLHTKKPVATVTPTPAPEPKKKDATPVVIVEFNYNGIIRHVQVIKLDNQYLKGLEITEGRDLKKRYQFKSFLRARGADCCRLIHFGPIADFKG